MGRKRAWSAAAAWAMSAFASISVENRAEAQSNAAIAEKLFLDGRALLTAGKVHEACDKFADSQRANPALGTLMHLASCHEKDHRPATAWSEFTDAAEQARNSGQHEREQFARTHAAALEKQLQKVVIEVSPAVAGIAVTLDSQPLPAGVVGTEIPLDPGNHDLEVTAPGKKPWHQPALNLGASAAVTHVSVALEEEAPPAAPAPLAAGPSSPPPVLAASRAPDEVPPTGQTAKRIAGFGAGAVGLGLLVVAGVEESTSISRDHDESKYPTTTAATQRAEVADQSKTAQTYAIVFGAAGLVAVGVGVYLVLTAHGDTTRDVPSAGPALRVAPYADARGGGLFIDGRL